MSVFVRVFVRVPVRVPVFVPVLICMCVRTHMHRAFYVENNKRSKAAALQVAGLRDSSRASVMLRVSVCLCVCLSVCLSVCEYCALPRVSTALASVSVSVSVSVSSASLAA